MRARKAPNPKSGAPARRTPPAKKAAAKIPSLSPKPAESKPPSAAESTPEAEVPSSSVDTPSKAKSPDSGTTLMVTPSSDSKPETSDEQAKVPVEDAQTTLSPKDGKVNPSSNSSQAAPTTKKVTRRVVKKKVVKKTPLSAKSGSTEQAEAGKSRVDEPSKEKNTAAAKDVVSPMNEVVVTKGVVSDEQEESTDQKAEDRGDAPVKGKTKLNTDVLSEVVPVGRMTRELDVGEGGGKDAGSQELMVVIEDKVEPWKEEGADNVENNKEPVNKQDDVDQDKDQDQDQHYNEAGEYVARPNDDEEQPAEEMVEYGEEEGFVEPGDEELQEDDGLETGEEVKTSEEEQMELTAAANERKLKKELEVFVGGLDRDVVEEDVRKAYEKVGEVVEVRLLKDPSSNRNRGFAFVRFAAKEQASRALSEMKNPVIRGKRCGTAPSEDNDVLFLGNICNTWTKEAIKQKLKDYSIEGVEYITLVQDPRHEGLSRGFCFIQFACHADAMHAYKRLQKPDAVFGHAERTAKVAFGEPLREPDPDVMAKVKSVFVDGLPPHWDEDRVRENFKRYGDIEKITLARNMSTAKRKDFGFVDFTTHEAAVACIKDVNSRDLTDGNVKAKVRARLSNPMPKTQAVKGGMCGGFRIGHPSGRSFGRGARPFVQPSFQYGRGRGRGRAFYQHGRGQYDFVGPYPDFHERRPFGKAGRRAPFQGGHQVMGGSVSSRPNPGGARLGRPAPSREVFPPETEGYPRSFTGRHFDQPYPYDDRAPGLKRPFYMTDQDPAYMEPSRMRPRFDYNDPVHGSRYNNDPVHGSHYRDSFGAGRSLYSSGYYGSDYGGGPYSSYRGGDRSYGGGSYSGPGGPYYYDV